MGYYDPISKKLNGPPKPDALFKVARSSLTP